MSKLFLNSVSNFSATNLRQASLKGLRRGLLVSSAAMVLAAVVSHQSAQAVPVGGTVNRGEFASITTGPVTTVVQTSDRGVLDWQSFDVGVGEVVNFQVPSSTGATLNRITGGGVSRIQGAVNSNGIVYFSNPNGLIFDAGSRVSANGFVATTANISALSFERSTNLPGLGALGAVGVNGLSLNGSVTANSIGAYAAAVTVGGSLDASNANGVGGRIQVTASDRVTLGETAVISATGSIGGGNVSIGGDLHGTGLTPNAQFVTVKAGSVINASALLSGNGGTVAVWADNATDFAGLITAKGGANSGNGGFVETSGKITLAFTGRADTSAAHGLVGTLLLDPRDIEIDSGTTSTNLTSSTTGGTKTWEPDTTNAAAGTVSHISVTDLVLALRTNNVIVDAQAGGTSNGNSGGKITVTSAIDWRTADAAVTQTNGTKLTLRSNAGSTGTFGTIDINADITGFNTGAAGSSLVVTGGSTITVKAGVTLDMGSNGNIDISGVATTPTGTQVAGKPDIVLNGTGTTAATKVTLTAGNVYLYVPSARTIAVKNTTITGILNVGHTSSSLTSGGISFVGTNEITGALKFGVSTAGAGDASSFTLASGNSLTVGSIDWVKNLTGAFTVTGSLTSTGKVDLRGTGVNTYTPTNAAGVTGGY